MAFSLCSLHHGGLRATLYRVAVAGPIELGVRPHSGEVLSNNMPCHANHVGVKAVGVKICMR